MSHGFTRHHLSPDLRDFSHRHVHKGLARFGASCLAPAAELTAFRNPPVVLRDREPARSVVHVVRQVRGRVRPEHNTVHELVQLITLHAPQLHIQVLLQCIL